MQCVFHSIRFKVNKVGIQRYPIFFALLSTRKRPQRKTLTSTKQTIYLWRNSHTPPPNHPKEERERNTRCANIQRRPEAKHCSSLCSQSEGDEYCGGQARAENPTKSWPDALAMFATCSWPSLCEQSELQCWRRNRRLCEPAANLRCKGAAAKLDCIWILNTLPFRGLRCANMQRKPEAKHCSSLCSQSEGDEDCGGQARAKNPTKSCAKALAMFATCSWPSLCKQSELQCWRRNRRLCGPAQFSAARALPLNFNFPEMPYKQSIRGRE